MRALPTGSVVPPMMHERRPDWVKLRIDSDYEMIQASTRTGYGRNGENGDYAFRARAEGNYLTASGLITELGNRLGRSLRILDIGAAAGTYVLNSLERGHDAQGLSAHDYRKSPRYHKITEQLPESAYVVGDAHYLDELEQIHDEYDLIVSSCTFFHLVDPLSVLEQAANKVGSDGILAVANIDAGSPYIKGTNAEGILGAFWAAGFDVGKTNYALAYFDIDPIIAERQGSTVPLRLPVDYQPTADRHYKLW